VPKRKICVVITARPSYSRIRTALKAIDEHPDLELQLVVAASALLGFGTKRMVEKAAAPLGLKVLRVKELALPRTMGVMYRKGAYLPPAATRLIQLIKAAVR